MEVSRTIFSIIILALVLLARVGIGAETTTGMSLVNAPSGLSAYSSGSVASGGAQAVLPTIYAGYTGAYGGCASPSADSTCNSCNRAGLNNCSLTSIHPNLYLLITLKSSTAATFTGSPRVRYKLSSNTTQSFVDDDGTQSLTVNSSFTAKIKWSSLCANAGATADCDNFPTSATLSVGIDNNSDGTLEEKVDFNIVVRYLDGAVATTIATACVPGVPAATTQEGICDYSLLKGDEKIYISDIAASSATLETPKTGVNYDRIVMFYAQGPEGDPNAVINPVTAISTNSPSYVLDLKSNSTTTPSLSDARITGLKNDTKYCFALANMDQTGIVSYFPNATTLANTSKICAVPTDVVGLLDDKSCFIATATFGSQMSSEVVTFREFRNKHLLTNAIGKRFVRFYYKYGPVAAKWISESELARSFSLGLLWPLLFFVKLVLAFGIFPTMLICFFGFVFLFRGLRHFRRNNATPV